MARRAAPAHPRAMIWLQPTWSDVVARVTAAVRRVFRRAQRPPAARFTPAPVEPGIWQLGWIEADIHEPCARAAMHGVRRPARPREETL